MMMQFFHFSTSVKQFLFKELDIKGEEAFIGTCVVVFFATFLLEGMKTLMLYLTTRLEQNPLTYGQTDGAEMDRQYLFSPLMIPSSIEHIKRKRLKYHCLAFLTHTMNILIAYFIMLAVMSYNVWITVGVLSGAGVGYFVFGAVGRAVQLKYAGLSVRDDSSGVYQINSMAPQDETRDGGYPDRL